MAHWRATRLGGDWVWEGGSRSSSCGVELSRGRVGQARGALGGDERPRGRRIAGGTEEEVAAGGPLGTD